MSAPCGFVFSLPFVIRKQLSSILDPDHAWESVAALMSDVTSEDVEACRDCQSPTDVLLAVWGSKGNRVLQLYNLLARTRCVRAMETIRHLVPSMYHHWEEECVRCNNIICVPVQSQSQTEPLSNVKPTAAPSVDSETNLLFTGLHNAPPVRYEEILIATNNFASDHMLGKGGYGVVYKGNWKHTLVAVKRIQARNGAGVEHDKERVRQSLQELRLLAKYRHDNILPLYGYSLDGAEPCLVYQLMTCSLQDALLCRKGTAPLSWPHRHNIALGCAKGLYFLHTISRTPIVHGDVKSANILLDKHLEAKLGDFGLSRDGQIESDHKTPLIASHIKGTLAYLPPELITSKILSTKLDVYSYGVVLLELSTGLRAYSDQRQPHSLVEYAAKYSDNVISALADRRLPPSRDSDVSCCVRFVTLGLHCSNKDHLLRPCFKQVVDSLNVH